MSWTPRCDIWEATYIRALNLYGCTREKAGWKVEALKNNTCCLVHIMIIHQNISAKLTVCIIELYFNWLKINHMLILLPLFGLLIYFPTEVLSPGIKTTWRHWIFCKGGCEPQYNNQHAWLALDSLERFILVYWNKFRESRTGIILFIFLWPKSKHVCGHIKLQFIWYWSLC